MTGSVDHAGAMGLVDERLALDANLPLGKALSFWEALDGCTQPGRALELLQLDPLMEVPVRYLSTGQKKRAALARLLNRNCPIWLLDEPLNNLDMKHAMGMMKLMQRACKELGKTVVLVLHDINFPSWYSDYIIAMKNGRVIRHGSRDDIITPEALKDIYDMDINVHEIGGHKVSLFYD